MSPQARTASSLLVRERMAVPEQTQREEHSQAELHIPVERSLVDWDQTQTASPAREETQSIALAAVVPAWARPREQRSAQHSGKNLERQAVLHSQKVAAQSGTQEVRSSEPAQRPSSRIAGTFLFCQRHYPGL